MRRSRPPLCNLCPQGLAKQLQVTPLPIADDEEAHHGFEGARCSSDAGVVASTDPLRIAIASHLLRCGKQVKLVLGHDPAEQPEPNPGLVEMVLQARRWVAGITSGRFTSLRAIATEEHCDKSHVSRLLTLAFLAPDIVERILTGNHAATLTPERLRKACPLPLLWAEQRALLID